MRRYHIVLLLPTFLFILSCTTFPAIPWPWEASHSKAPESPKPPATASAPEQEPSQLPADPPPAAKPRPTARDMGSTITPGLAADDEVQVVSLATTDPAVTSSKEPEPEQLSPARPVLAPLPAPEAEPRENKVAGNETEAAAPPAVEASAEPVPEAEPDPGIDAAQSATEAGVPRPAPCLAQDAANGTAAGTPLPDPTDPKEQQKLIDEALDLYQEALELRAKDEPEKAIHALDRCYQIISSLNGDADPEIAQQKEDIRLLISRRILEIYAARSRLQFSRSREIPLVMNEHVAREIKRFQNGERRFFTESYRRSGKYRPYIVRQMKRFGLPEELSWLPLIESGFKVKALSRARALGPWQFIASTAYRMDLRRDRWVDERMDMEKSTQAAIRYLKALHDLFGDWTTVLAAYNCGEGNVLRVIREQHVNYLDNFWDLYSRLPVETARYVPRFLAALHIIKNPGAYGFHDLVLDSPLEYETVEVSRQMRLRDLARVLGVPRAVLEELNPSLRYKVTPDYPFALKVPPGTAPTLVAKLDKVPTYRPPKRAYLVHRVRRGETLSEIAMKYKVPMSRIVRANNLRSARFIRAGQKLRIPLQGRVVSAAAEIDLEPGKTIRYRVRRGDSWWLIAKRFGTTVEKLKRLNGIRSNLLRQGQLIRVQAGTR